MQEKNYKECKKKKKKREREKKAENIYIKKSRNSRKNLMPAITCRRNDYFTHILRMIILSLISHLTDKMDFYFPSLLEKFHKPISK